MASVLGGTFPAAGDTLSCTNDDRTVSVAAEIAFSADRDAGEVGLVEVTTPYLALSTAEAETLAFAEVTVDRIQIGLESPGVGPMTVTLDLVRAAEFDGNGGPDTDVVVAGVGRVASVGTTVLTCEGW